jgi:hypothetical protein
MPTLCGVVTVCVVEGNRLNIQPGLRNHLLNLRGLRLIIM